MSAAPPMMLVVLFAWFLATATHGAGPTESMSLEPTGEGIGVATGVLTLPGSPHYHGHLLTDASNWTGLFAHGSGYGP